MKINIPQVDLKHPLVKKMVEFHMNNMRQQIGDKDGYDFNVIPYDKYNYNEALREYLEKQYISIMIFCKSHINELFLAFRLIYPMSVLEGWT
jgi:hypothetical protein